MKKVIEKVVKQIVEGSFDQRVVNLGSELSFKFFWASLLMEKDVKHVEGENQMHFGYTCLLPDGRAVTTMSCDEWDQVYFVMISE